RTVPDQPRIPPLSSTGYGYAPANRPTFTWAKPAPYVVFNSITDNPKVGDERPFLAVGTGNGPVFDRIVVHDHQELVFRVFYDNDEAPNLATDSINTRLKILLPHRPARATYAAAYIASDNAYPRVVSDTVNFVGARLFS